MKRVGKVESLLGEEGQGGGELTLQEVQLPLIYTSWIYSHLAWRCDDLGFNNVHYNTCLYSLLYG